MHFAPKSVSDFLRMPFDEVIDVRAPAEFAEDRIPGAINLPVLNDEERSRVGTIYTRQSKFDGRRIGAAIASRNIAEHLETHFADKDGSCAPLVYCWRGGMRSGALCEVLSRVGWKAETLVGGYRSYRKLVSKYLYEDPFPAKAVLLDGNTGTGKTEILALLQRNGVQTIDLECLANHCGSLFGAKREPQPSQKSFESSLAWEIASLDPGRPVVIEAESSKVGDRIIPPTMWRAMQSAHRIEIKASQADRAEYLVARFEPVRTDGPRIRRIIESLRPYHSGNAISEWLALADSGEFCPLAEQLIERHYDPRYVKHRDVCRSKMKHMIELKDMSRGSLEIAAAGIAAAVDELQARPTG